MKSKHEWQWITKIKITAFDRAGNIIDVWESGNLLMNVGLNMQRDSLMGDAKTGTADATEANKLHDDDATFSAGDVGKRVCNTTDKTCSLITGFVDSGEFDLADDIMADTEDYVIYPSGDGIMYLAWGSDNTPPAVGQTQLVAETARQTMTSKTAGGTGELISVVYINPATAVAPPNIEELGWFAGVTAGAGADTGIIVGRVLYSRAKTNIESLQIERTDLIAEV